ncbi:winged helix-turn-helix domain-containing protein, partial [Escherichia coli]
KELEVISLNLEKTVKDKEHFFFELDQEIKRFAAFNQCSTVNDKVVKLIRSKL